MTTLQTGYMAVAKALTEDDSRMMRMGGGDDIDPNKADAKRFAQEGGSLMRMATWRAWRRLMKSLASTR